MVPSGIKTGDNECSLLLSLPGDGFFLRGKPEAFTDALQLKLKQASSQLFNCSQNKLYHF